MWFALKSFLLFCVDQYAPKRIVTFNPKTSLLWDNIRLKQLRNTRDKSYKHAVLSNLPEDWASYAGARTSYQKEYRLNMIGYFSDKTSSGLKSGKKFWDFYRNFIKTKNDKNGQTSIERIKFNDTLIIGSKNVSCFFNSFFSSITSISPIQTPESISFINSHFSNLNRNLTNVSPFSFNFVSLKEVTELLEILDNSCSPGVSDIPVKVWKSIDYAEM